MNVNLSCYSKKISLLSLLLMSSSGHASNLMAEFSAHVGGTQIAVVEHYGDFPETVSAGGGYTGMLGFKLNLHDSVYLKTQIGYSTDTASSDEVSATWSYFPLETVLVTKIHHVTVGAGFAYHMLPGFSEKTLGGHYYDEVSIVNIDYKNALGYVFEVGLDLHSVFLNLKYKKIEYVAESGQSILDGNSLGVGIGFFFG